MSPYFDKQYPFGREWGYTQALADGFGAPVDAFRSVSRVPGLSWRTAALGLTLPAHKGLVPAAALRLVTPLTEQSRYLADIARSRAPEKLKFEPVPALVKIVEALPEKMFLFFMELLHYPAVALRAARLMWKSLFEYIPALPKVLRRVGSRYLGSARLMRDRLRNGGLLKSDRELLNMLSLGILNNAAEQFPWLHDLQVAWNWLSERFRFSAQPVSARNINAPLKLSDLRFEPKFHLNGLQLETYLGSDLILYSSMGRPGAAAFLVNTPGSVAAGALLAHVARWELENERRQVLYRLGSNVINLIIKYLALGPVGLLISALHLLAERLVDVSFQNRQLILPKILPSLREV